MDANTITLHEEKYEKYIGYYKKLLNEAEKSYFTEIGVRGHSRSLKVAPFGRSCVVSY